MTNYCKLVTQQFWNPKDHLGSEHSLAVIRGIPRRSCLGIAWWFLGGAWIVGSCWIWCMISSWTPWGSPKIKVNLNPMKLTLRWNHVKSSSLALVIWNPMEMLILLAVPWRASSWRQHRACGIDLKTSGVWAGHPLWNDSWPSPRNMEVSLDGAIARWMVSNGTSYWHGWWLGVPPGNLQV